MKLRLSLFSLSAAAVSAMVVSTGFVARSDAASVSAGGSSERSTISILTVGRQVRIPVLDPARNLGSQQIVSLGLETLMKLAPDGSVKPYLASSVTHPNPFTYIYTLRKQIKFWDGNELTAADVANALNYYRFPQFRTSSAYTSVRRITAPSRYRVVVTLKRRDASWQYVPTFAYGIFEKKFADEHAGTMGQPGVLTMGTGPWIPTSLNPATGVEFTANPRWWGGQVPIRRISFRFFADETSMALALRAGEIDLAPIVVNGRSFAATSGSPVVSIPSCVEAFWSMNTQLPPWNDVHVRRAVAYAVNRRDMIAAIGGYSTATSTFIPPLSLRSIASTQQVKELLKTIPSYPFDPAKARQEMARSAYPNGFSAVTNAYPLDPYIAVSQVIAAELKPLGINLQVNTSTAGAWVAEHITGDRSKTGPFYTDSSCPTPDPSYYPATFLNSRLARAGGNNFANYQNGTADQLLAAAVATDNAKKRLDLYGKLLRRIAADVPYVPLLVENANYAISSKFKWPGFVQPYYNGAPWPLGIEPR